MIREFKQGTKLKINVYFKPIKDSLVYNTAYLKKDIPSKPFGDNFEAVSFWVDNKLMVYPMDMIDHCEFYEEP